MAVTDLASAGNDRISIALATYNGERFLAEQLESFCSQIRTPDELVVCDDGSTDATVRIVEDFSARAPFNVRIHQNASRLNFSRNFERAVALCSGDIIFISDQDDVWFPTKIQTICDVFEADQDAQTVLNGQIITDAELRHKNVTLLDNLRVFGMDADDLIAGCATALRKPWADLLLPLPGEADGLFEGGFLTYDRWINQLSAVLGLRRFIDAPLQFFRQHGGNASASALHSSRGTRSAFLLADRLSHAPTQAWWRRVEVLNLYDDWLDANASALRKLGASTDHACRAVAEERECLLARITLVSQSFFRRAKGVMKLWSSGGYARFNGWKSALNDLARNPAGRPTSHR